MKPFVIHAGKLTLKDLMAHYYQFQPIAVSQQAKSKVLAARKIVEDYVNNKTVAYGINTGFGKLANTIISSDKLNQLQRNLVLSHSAGTGPLMSQDCIRIILLLKINGLLQGFSGVRWEVIEALVNLYNAGITPCIPAKGSVGASGDLAPLAHLACALIGEGDVIYQGKRIKAIEALQVIKQPPLVLAPKEGLALLNGTQVSTAYAVRAIIGCQQLFDAAIYAGALSLEAVNGDLAVLDERIHAVRGMKGQKEVAAVLSLLLQKDNRSHKKNKNVQDPYSLRCQSQVMGACLEQLQYCASKIATEINAVTDNPLVFTEGREIVSGGNFHAQLIAFAADAMATVIATIGNISERRIALLMEPSVSGLPTFLVKDGGENSGFMIAHVTAAALASENKVYAHPASVDSIPTSNNQEDHVSMATFAARRLEEMIDNAMTIVGIELIASCQGIDLSHFTPAEKLSVLHNKIRKFISFYDVDRYLSDDIMQMKRLIVNREFVLSSQIGFNRCALF